ncbi:hypothetical protein ACTFIU_009975 [Dictyostelium citrinum]
MIELYSSVENKKQHEKHPHSTISFNKNTNDNISRETKIVCRQTPTQTWGIGNYAKYHYIELPLVVVLPPHPPVEHSPTNGSTTTVPAITTTVTILTIASITAPTAPKPVTCNASPDPR